MRAGTATRLALSLGALLLACGCGSWKRFAYEGFDRDSWQQPERVIETLDLAPGDFVADVGAGGGYFTFDLAEAVTPVGRVYAVDVDANMTEYLSDRIAKDGIENVEVVLGEFGDPLLPDGEIDLLFTSNTYHHIQDRIAYFRRVRNDLTRDGRVAILELNDSSWFPRWFGHHTPMETIEAEMREAGYTLDASFDFIDRQHFAIFSPSP
jgi:ubiquinone/menaquinone biosynthesis C-methylase UbiE